LVRIVVFGDRTTREKYEQKHAKWQKWICSGWREYPNLGSESELKNGEQRFGLCKPSASSIAGAGEFLRPPPHVPF
jgi:hypothetical protein